MRFQQRTTPETVAYSSSAAAPTLSWPDAVAYQEAIQLPRLSLFEPWLQSAEISLDRRGMPVVYTGRFAVVFRLTTATGERWALRCFTSALEGQDRIGRYDAIRETLEQNEETLAPYFVPFVFLPQGVKVGTNWYPALAMRWASGKPLGRWVEENRYEPEKLRVLCGVLSGLLERLESAGIAHGDWQHDNLLISDTGYAVTLVDYDGLYVPALAGNPAAESGHPNYQHPLRSPGDYGPGMDRFACLVMQAALLGLSHDPSLWERFSDGESLLFKKVDFTDTERSPLFRTLRELAETHQDELLADSVARLQDACLSDAGSVLAPAIAPVAPSDTPSFVANLPAAPQGSAPLPHDVNAPNVAGRGKWWLLPEVTARTSPPTIVQAPVSIVQAAAQAAGISPRVQPQRNYSLSASATQAQMTFKYLDQLRDPEVQAAEQRHLWGWRAGAVGFLSVVSLLIYAWISSRNGFFPFYFFWLINFANLGYTRWPRKRIYDELVAEITKMENLIEARQKNINEKNTQTPIRPLSSPSGVNSMALSDFVADRLKQTSINRVLTVPGINVSTLRQLRAEGIDTALDLQRRTNIARIPPHQVTALQNWCREMESQAQDDYRKAGGANSSTVGRSVPVDVARLQHEVAEFERHVELLKQERERFPDASAGAYARKLFGIAEPNPQTTP